MKNLIFTTIIFAFFLSCDKKEIVVDNLSFDVSVDKSNFHVGDTVTFRFSGENPDIISFYSGETLNDYRYLEEDKFMDSKMFMSFLSSRFDGQSNPALPKDEDPARLKYSTDFNGSYDEASIKAATWTDITDRFFIPATTTSGLATPQPSGKADVSDILRSPDEGVYIGWFYQAPNGKRRTQFRFESLAVEAIIPELTDIAQVLYNFASAEFQLILGAGYAGTVLNDQPQILGNAVRFRAPIGTTQPHREAWLISKPLYRPGATNIGPALGVGIKSFNAPDISSHTHVYKAAGTYLVTFVVQNANIYGSKKEVKQIEIVVEE